MGRGDSQCTTQNFTDRQYDNSLQPEITDGGSQKQERG